MSAGLPMIARTLTAVWILAFANPEVRADTPHGFYALSEPAAAVLRGLPRLPSCGERARRYLVSHANLDIYYNGSVRVNSETWSVVASSNEMLNIKDPNTTKDVSVSLYLYRDKAVALGTLIFEGLKKDGIEYCRDVQG